jgi:beta-lactamase superfamily II metal-dependent hydrolase
VVAVAGQFLRRTTQAGCDIGQLAIGGNHDNALSVALKIRYGDFDYFIGGDLTGGGNRTHQVEQAIAESVGNVDVLKVNHHGSATSSSDVFLNYLRPEVAVISVGNGGVNRHYGLPRQDVLDRIAALSNHPVIFLTQRGEGGSISNQYVEDRDGVSHATRRGYSVNGIVFPVDEAG